MYMCEVFPTCEYVGVRRDRSERNPVVSRGASVHRRKQDVFGSQRDRSAGRAVTWTMDKRVYLVPSLNDDCFSFSHFPNMLNIFMRAWNRFFVPVGFISW